jgi:hypothetical protein
MPKRALTEGVFYFKLSRFVSFSRLRLKSFVVILCAAWLCASGDAFAQTSFEGRTQSIETSEPLNSSSVSNLNRIIAEPGLDGLLDGALPFENRSQAGMPSRSPLPASPPPRISNPGLLQAFQRQKEEKDWVFRGANAEEFGLTPAQIFGLRDNEKHKSSSAESPSAMERFFNQSQKRGDIMISQPEAGENLNESVAGRSLFSQRSPHQSVLQVEREAGLGLLFDDQGQAGSRFGQNQSTADVFGNGKPYNAGNGLNTVQKAGFKERMEEFERFYSRGDDSSSRSSGAASFWQSPLTTHNPSSTQPVLPAPTPIGPQPRVPFGTIANPTDHFSSLARPQEISVVPSGFETPSSLQVEPQRPSAAPAGFSMPRRKF